MLRRKINGNSGIFDYLYTVPRLMVCQAESKARIPILSLCGLVYGSADGSCWKECRVGSGRRGGGSLDDTPPLAEDCYRNNGQGTSLYLSC
jgi:hypothetical protein